MIQPTQAQWMHIMHGTFYTEIGRGKFQHNNRAMMDGADVIIYRSNSDGVLLVRLVDEFEDGRFIKVTEMTRPTQAQMRALSASDTACYKWPEDTPEHRACRAAYIEGATAAAQVGEPSQEDNLHFTKQERHDQQVELYITLGHAMIERCAQVVKRFSNPQTYGTIEAIIAELDKLKDAP